MSMALSSAQPVTLNLSCARNLRARTDEDQPGVRPTLKSRASTTRRRGLERAASETRLPGVSATAEKCSADSGHASLAAQVVRCGRRNGRMAQLRALAAIERRRSGAGAARARFLK